MHKLLLGTAVPVLLYSSAALTAETGSEPHHEAAHVPLQLVINKHFTDSRNRLAPSVGSSTYQFSPKDIVTLPQGEFTSFNQVLLRAPGVTQDSYGQLHVRGDHSNLQYRINGIIIPEGISGFGQTLDTHFADKIALLTGALPAQYGYRTAGVVDVTTKTGAVENGGRSSIQAGSYDTISLNQQLYGSQGKLSYYLTGTYDSNSRGIEPPTPAKPRHDDTQQDKEFAYMSYTLNPENRASFIFGNATNRFEIPRNPGQPAQFMLNGAPAFASDAVDENQYERNTYGIAALNGAINDRTDYQFALFSRNSGVLFKPDPVGDLIFTGVASRVERKSFTTGVQSDFSYFLDKSHTLRSGFTASYEKASSGTSSSVFDAGGGCDATPCTPFTIPDTNDQGAVLLGVYAQDEWRVADTLTVNYGARFDYYDAYIQDSELSPRVGLVYEATPGTKLHAGYARYFTPPPTELIAPVTVAAFQNTTGAPPGTGSSDVTPERSHYFDIGVVHNVNSKLTLGVDAYYKLMKGVLDKGQFGSALIFSPFNYSKGFAQGIEFTGDYRDGAFSGYSNVALARAMGKNVASGEFNFDPVTELPYLAGHYVNLDHSQTVSGSAGVAYALGGMEYSGDVFYGSGLRNGDFNTKHLPFYAQANMAVEHHFDLGTAGMVEGRFSVINVFDRMYQIRDGSGIGVFAPQYGPRRMFLVSLSKAF